MSTLLGECEVCVSVHGMVKRCEEVDTGCYVEESEEFSFFFLFNPAQVLCTARCALRLHSVLCTAPGWCEPSGHNRIYLYDIFMPMLCAFRLCVSVLLGSPLGRVLWARLPRQKLQLGFENNFETLAGFLH